MLTVFVQYVLTTRKIMIMSTINFPLLCRLSNAWRRAPGDSWAENKAYQDWKDYIIACLYDITGETIVEDSTGVCIIRGTRVKISQSTNYYAFDGAWLCPGDNPARQEDLLKILKW